MLLEMEGRREVDGVLAMVSRRMRSIGDRGSQTVAFYRHSCRSMVIFVRISQRDIVHARRFKELGLVGDMVTTEGRKAASASTGGYPRIRTVTP